MSELRPQRDRVVVRCDELDMIRRNQEQISILQAQQRFALAALAGKSGLVRRYVTDEVAATLRLSPRQARNRMEDGEMFASFPAVAGKVEQRVWLMEHADAVLDELVGSGLSHEEQEQVLELVLARAGGTPWELRRAVRTAIVVLFPEHAHERAKKAVADRDVRSFADDVGAASLIASGSAVDVAAMMASLEALCWPGEPGDTRTMAQRKFDALRDLVCGRRQPGDWQANVLVALTTLQGKDDLAAEIPGFGPISASQARDIVAEGASLRRIVVDDHGQLVAVESRIHRPDLDVEDSNPWWTVEPADEAPDPDGPSAEDLAWQAAECAATDLPVEPVCGDEPTDEIASPSARPSEDAGPAGEPKRRTAKRRAPAAQQAWSSAGLLKALRWMSSEPWSSVDLTTDKYVVPRRLKRHLEHRDKTCIYPGCPRPAAQCDKDHLLEWPRGRTSEINLASECDPHHHAKHEYFTVTRLPDGTFRWTAPNGRQYDRKPKPVVESWAYRELLGHEPPVDGGEELPPEDDPPDHQPPDATQF